MKESKLTIGEPFALGAEQIAGVFAYKFAKLGCEVFVSDDEYVVNVHVRKHEFFNTIHFLKKYKKTIAEIDKMFSIIERNMV